MPVGCYCTAVNCSCKRQVSILEVGRAEPLPPWPTIEEIKKAVRDELRKAGVI